MKFDWTRKEQKMEHTMSYLYKELLDGSEKYIMTAIGQAIGMSSFPDGLDPEVTKAVDDGLKYWKGSKDLMIEMAALADERDYTQRCEMQKVQEQLDEMSKKLDILMKKKGE